MEVTTIGIDLAKNVFAVCGADSSGRVLMRRQLRRAQVLSFMRGLPRCVVGIEATGGAQYWARQLTALGHEVRLMSPAARRLGTSFTEALTLQTLVNCQTLP